MTKAISRFPLDEIPAAGRADRLAAAAGDVARELEQRYPGAEYRHVSADEKSEHVQFRREHRVLRGLGWGLLVALQSNDLSVLMLRVEAWSRVRTLLMKAMLVLGVGAGALVAILRDGDDTGSGRKLQFFLICVAGLAVGAVLFLLVDLLGKAMTSGAKRQALADEVQRVHDALAPVVAARAGGR